jgi:hypothetical protein
MFLSPLSNRPLDEPVDVPPPLRFKPTVGRIRHLEIDFHTPPQISYGRTAAQRDGLRYEDRVQRFLCREFPSYVRSPVIRWVDDSGVRFCVPDGLLRNRSTVFVIEVKSQHMPEAYWQLVKMYAPLLALKYSGCSIRCLEVVKSYDPAVPFPCKVEVVSDLPSYFSKPPQREVAVFQWKAK